MHLVSCYRNLLRCLSGTGFRKGEDSSTYKADGEGPVESLPLHHEIFA